MFQESERGKRGLFESLFVFLNVSLWCLAHEAYAYLTLRAIRKLAFRRKEELSG